VHSAIRELGAGRFSHWRGVLYFSSLDNSDPRHNGRTYSIEVPRSLLSVVPGLAPGPSSGLAIAVAGVFTLIAPWAPVTVLALAERRVWIRFQTLPFLAASGVLALVTWGLYRNALDVTRPGSRWAHAAVLATLLLISMAYPLLGWFVERRHQLQRRLPPTARVLDRVGNVAWGVAMILLAAECAARLVPLVDSLAINPGSRFLWPAWHDPRNALGFNDREYGPKPGPRVLLLGDSYTEGAGVAKHERFSARLEGLLRRTGPTVEVVNAGGSGLDTFEEASILVRIGDVIQPDVVVVAYVLNDADGMDPESRRPLAPGDHFFIHTLGSYAYYRFYTMRGPWSVGSREAVWSTWRSRHQEGSPGWQRVLEGLDRVALWCDERGVHRYLVVYPVFAAGTERMRDVMD
ncbi:MAG: SGNH/GDSL hydrolase family protein, partial [Tepidiformaceae bacterium]